MIIDVHCHLFSPGLAEAIAERTPYRFPVDQEKGIMSTLLGLKLPLSAEEERITEMDRMGIDTQVISVRTTELLSPEELSRSPQTREQLSQAINDYLASMCQHFPGRFMAFADIPLLINDMDAAIREMVRSIDNLGLNGISLLTHYSDKYLDASEFQSFFEEANRRRLVIFLHPTQPIGEGVLVDYSMYGLVGLPYDTTLTIARMVYAGIIERFPDITFIISHAGGTIPFLWWRINMGYMLDFPGCRKCINKLPSEYMEHFYYDTAMSDTESLMLTYLRVGDRLMLGTDHPFTDSGIQRTIDTIEAMDIPSESKVKILGENASTLLCK